MLCQDEFIWQDVVEVPLETFTLELTSQLFPFGNVTDVHFEQIGAVHVKQFFVVVLIVNSITVREYFILRLQFRVQHYHPDFDYASRVDAVRVFIAGKSVRMERAENVSHSRTRDRLQTAATHPDAERHF